MGAEQRGSGRRVQKENERVHEQQRNATDHELHRPRRAQENKTNSQNLKKMAYLTKKMNLKLLKNTLKNCLLKILIFNYKKKHLLQYIPEKIDKTPRKNS